MDPIIAAFEAWAEEFSCDPSSRLFDHGRKVSEEIVRVFEDGSAEVDKYNHIPEDSTEPHVQHCWGLYAMFR